MEITNFRNYALSKPYSPEYVSALVDITTGWWLWRKTETRRISRSYVEGWVFQGTDKPTPWCVYGMENTYLAKLRHKRRCKAL